MGGQLDVLCVDLVADRFQYPGALVLGKVVAECERDREREKERERERERETSKQTLS